MKPITELSTAPSSDWNIDFQEAVNIVLSKFWLVVLCFLTGVSLGLLYIAISPRVYEATATIQVEQAGRKVVKIEDVSTEDLKDSEIVKTIEQNFLRKSLILRAVKRLNLEDDPEFAFVVKKAKRKKEDPEMCIAEIILGKNLGVRLRRGTRLIDISTSSKNPQTAANLANAIVDEFMQETVETRYGNSQSAFSFLMEEAERLKAKLSVSELALQDYQYVIQLKNRIIEQEKEIDRLNQRYMEKHPKLIQARTLLKDLQANFLNEMKKVPIVVSEQSNRVSPKGKRETADDKFKHELRRAESKFNVLTRDVQTDRELYESILQRLKETNITKGLTSVNLRIAERAFEPEKPVKPRILLALAFSIVAGPTLGIGLIFFINTFDSSLKTVDIAEKYLDLPVLCAVPDAKKEETLTQDSSSSHGLRWRIQRLIGSLVALSFKNSQVYGDSLPTVREASSDVLHSLRNNIKSLLGIPSHGRGNSSRPQEYPLVLVQDPGCKVSEAMRTLRVNLSLLGKKADLYSFLFTSSIPFEGKSFTAANFAVALAMQDHKTLLIDADLRRPTIHRYFGKSLSMGVTDYLLGQKTFEEILKPTMHENLQVITAGSQCPNPAELLATNDFEELLATAKKTFNRVIIDSAPINAVGDTLLLVSKVQHVCIVVQALQTPRRPVKRACMQLENARGHLVGVVLNRVPEHTGFGQDPYYYYYQSSSGYGKCYGTSYDRKSNHQTQRAEIAANPPNGSSLEG